MQIKLLLADDDVELVSMLQEYLTREGLVVDVVYNGEQAVVAALSSRYALLVLDVMMPGMSGIDALKRIRAESSMPILMLTARGDDTDRIVGLELGADDYVAKPCTPRELLARIRAILRRSSVNPEMTGTDQAAIAVGDLLMLPAMRKAEWRRQSLELTSTEFNLLEILARNAGTVVSKQVLSEQGLGRSLARFDRGIDVHMSSIRQKLGQLADGRSCIQTVYRKGYQLIRE